MFSSTWFTAAIPLLVEGRELPAPLMQDAMRALTSGQASEVEAAAFLVGLRTKGETAGEVSAAVGVLREKMTKLVPSAPGILDTCGTGGDGSGTFNISTAVALVVAAAGCPVVKHGNRSVSSRSGSADVLAALGVPIENGPAWAQRCLDTLGFAFCLAPQFHPCLAHVGPVRKKLGVRTIFNLLGPLLNPAGAQYQLLGVGKLELLDTLAGALSNVGAKQAFLVCSEEGLDEVSLSSVTHVRRVCGSEAAALTWTADDFGMEPAPLSEMKADGPEQSAAVIRDVLAGKQGAPRRIVLANAAAALFAAERVPNLREGVARAAAAVDGGAARNLLERLAVRTKNRGRGNMSQKAILIADPGIDTAFAIALALHDPKIEVIGLVASAGNVSAEQSTQNVHILINEIDVPKWPRIGAALPVEYELDGTKLHGPGGLGGVTFPSATLHQPLPGDKLIVELVRANPKEVAVVVLGPCTMLERALDRDPDLAHLIERIVVVGGSWHEPGNASAVAEFHFQCDPAAARRVIQCGAPVTLLPLDVTRKLIFSPSDLLELPTCESPTCKFLRQIVPYGIRASSNLYGIEGFHLKDVLGVAHLSVHGLVSTERACVDVETKGELTRGMTVVDARPVLAGPKNVQLGMGVDVVGVRDYIYSVLASTK